MVNRILTVGDDFTLDPKVKAGDANLPERLSAAALSATFAPRWKAGTSYAAGSYVTAPDGMVVRAKAAFTAASTYDSTKWEYGTLPGSSNIPVIKSDTDTRPGVFEFTHNSTTGYLYHLLAGPSFGGAAAILAIGNDNGTGTSILLPNKAGGKALVIDQRPTVTSDTAYGIHATQRSTAAPLVRLEQNVDGAAPALQVLSFGTVTNAQQRMVYFGDSVGEAGAIYALDGRFEWRRNLRIMAKSGTVDSFLEVVENSGITYGAPQAKQSRMMKDRIAWWAPSGDNVNHWAYEILAGGSTLQFRTGPNGAFGTTPTQTMIGVRHNQLGFYGATPVARAAAIAAPSGGTTVDTEARATLTSLLTAVKNIGITL